MNWFFYLAKKSTFKYVTISKNVFELFGTYLDFISKFILFYLYFWLRMALWSDHQMYFRIFENVSLYGRIPCTLYNFFENQFYLELCSLHSHHNFHLLKYFLALSSVRFLGFMKKMHLFSHNRPKQIWIKNPLLRKIPSKT